jgi:hypothetical protein
VLTRRQHDHARIAPQPRRCGRAQCLEQQRRVLLDRQHLLAREQLRKEPQHHLAVFEHVRHARGRAQVVFEHVPKTVFVPDQIDAGDMRVDAVRQVDAAHRRLIRVVLGHLLGGDLAGLQDLLLVVDVVQEPVQRRDALLQAALERIPFGARDDPRHDVERYQPLVTLLVAVDGERDADAMKQQVGLAALLRDAPGRSLGEPIGERLEMRAHVAVRLARLVVVMAFHCLGQEKGSVPIFANTGASAGAWRRLPWY